MFNWKKNLLALILVVQIFSLSFAQDAPQTNGTTTVTSNSSNTTPTGAAKGVNPLGSYGGSNFDKVNLFNGNVSMSFPLASLTSRGGMSIGVVLSYNSKLWRVERHETETGFSQGKRINNNTSVTYYPVYDEPDYSLGQVAAGWTIQTGRMRGNQSIFTEKNNFTCVFPGPGVQKPKPKLTLTTFTFTSPDGTEYDFRDVIYDGQPKALVNCEGLSRGKEFVSKDGTSATFISDTEVFDSVFGGQITAPNGPNGFVYLRDGTRFRIEDGLVKQQRDNNGNLVRYTYDGGRLIELEDNMGRKIILEYPQRRGILVKVTIKGIGGADRVTLVKGNDLGSALAPGNTIKKLDELFPVETVTISSPNFLFNDRVISEVLLPDGHKWEFLHNSYGEIVRVKTPARGLVEFEMGPAANSAQKGGYLENLNEIFRRVVSRKTYPSDTGPAEGLVTYSDPRDTSKIDSSQNLTVEQEELDPQNSDRLLAKSSHKFSGHPTLNLKAQPFAYKPWLEGKELRTEQFNFDAATAMRRSITDYEQESGVSWIPGADTTFRSQPENNPRVIRTTNSLLDGASPKTSKTEYNYDSFNNVTKEVLTGYNNEIIRQVERTYVTNLNGINYPGLNVQNGGIDTHLRSLISSQTIKDGAGATESVTKYEYDQYSGTNNAALLSRTLSVTTHAQPYQSPTRIHRGNITSVTAGFGTPDATTLYSHYDVLGNVIRVLGPNPDQKSETTYNLTSQFTFPDESKQYVSGGLSGNRVLTSSRVFDFHTGAVTSSTGLNGDTTSFQYNDLLDRLTLEIRPLDTQIGGFGRTRYTYSAPGVYPNTVTVETSLDNEGPNRVLTSISEFDGFLRTIKQSRTDGADSNQPKVSSETFYDALGRVNKVTNPFRQGQIVSTDGYTTSQYDALSRVFRIQTFDNVDALTGTVNTVYDTNLVTVTDQAGKQRKSETDASGRLVKVYEPNPINQQLDQVTEYSYDSRSNLLEVNQDVQTRSFSYDSLSRLTSASSPESGTASANGVTTYKYDKASNLIERKDPRNIITTYNYDSLNRLAVKDYSDTTPKVNYFYDVVPSNLPSGVTAPSSFAFANLLGRATAVISPSTPRDPATGLFHTYDVGGRITKSSQLLDSQHYTTSSEYNLASLPTGHIYPSTRTISHSFNIAGQITDVRSNDNLISQGATYTAGGAIESHQLGNSLYHSIRYNSRLQPIEITLGQFPFTDERLRLSYDYGLYPLSSLSSATTSDAQLDQSKNNGNIGKITIRTGVEGGGGGDQLTSGRTLVKGDSKPSLNFVSNAVFEQAFAYDELNRLKLAKEFGDLGCPTVGNGNANSIVAEIEPQKSTTLTLQGTSLNQLQNLSVSGSGLNVSIVSSSATSITLTFDASSGSTGLHELRFSSACGDFTSGLISVACASTEALGKTGDIFAVDGVGTFTAINRDPSTFLTLEPKVHSEGKASFEIDLSNSNLTQDPNFGIYFFYGSKVVTNVLSTNTKVNMQILINGRVASVRFGGPGGTFTSSLDYLEVDVDSAGTITGNGNTIERNRHDFIYFLPLLADGSNTKLKVDIFYTVDIVSQSGLLPFVFFDVFARPSCTDLNNFSTSIEPAPLALNPGVTWNQSFDYDRFGNRLSVSGINSQVLQISSQKNRITDLGYEYDLAGNLIKDPSGKAYEYDAENRLVKVFNGSTLLAEYFYDGNGWRVKKVVSSGSTTRFVYDQGGKLLSEYDGEQILIASPTREHIYGASGMLATVESDKTNYHTPDHLGSPRVLTDAAGSVISRRDHLPFGEQLPDSIGNRASIFGYSSTNDNIKQKFTGYFKDDESGLDFAQARYYANISGRFISIDPINGTPRNPQTWNRYVYTLNNPLKFTDPTGLLLQSPQDQGGEEDAVIDRTYVTEFINYIDTLYTSFFGGQAELPGLGSSEKEFLLQQQIYPGKNVTFRDAVIANSSAFVEAGDTMLMIGEYFPGVGWGATFLGNRLGTRSNFELIFAVGGTLLGGKELANVEKLTANLADNVFFHYTSDEGLQGILSSGKIMPGMKGRTQFTQQMFSSSEADNILFIGSPTHAGRGANVIAVRMPPDVQLQTIKQGEHIYQGTFHLTKENVIYAGKNPF